MNERFEELLSRYLDGDEDAGVPGELREHLEADPELRKRFRGEVRLHTLVREITSEAGSGRVRPAARRRRTFVSARYLLAAAAMVLLALGIRFVTAPPAPAPVTTPGEGSVLANLVRAARGVRTAEDMRALHPLAKSAYDEELSRNDDCMLERLVLLGLSERMCEVPRDDRQAEGLRFVIDRASRLEVGESGRTAYVDLMPAAEAAASGMTLERKRLFKKAYLEAREYLKRGDYYLYAGKVNVMCNIAGICSLERTSRLSYAYVLLWERNISGAMFKYCEGWLPGSMYDEHYRNYLRPLVIQKVERARKLAESLGFDIEKVRDNRRVKKGWCISAPDGVIVVEYVYTNRDNVVRILDCTPFLEAEFTGMIRPEKGSPGGMVPESRIGVLYSVDGKTGKLIWLEKEWVPLTDWVVESKELHRWAHFRLHVTRLENGSWRHRLFLRWEGDLEETKAQDEIWTDPTSDSPARVGLACNRSAARWLELGLRIIRPAEGK